MSHLVRMIQINNCGECPFTEDDPGSVRLRCWADEEDVKMLLPLNEEVPESCPLKKADIVITSHLMDLVKTEAGTREFKQFVEDADEPVG